MPSTTWASRDVIISSLHFLGWLVIVRWITIHLGVPAFTGSLGDEEAPGFAPGRHRRSFASAGGLGKLMGGPVIATGQETDIPCDRLARDRLFPRSSQQGLTGVFGDPVAKNPTQAMLVPAFAELGLDWRRDLTVRVRAADLRDAAIAWEGMCSSSRGHGCRRQRHVDRTVSRRRGPAPGPPRLAPPPRLVCDVIPNPPRTLFLQEADANGFTILDGLGMLVNQGVIGVQLCSGRTPSAAIMRSALEAICGGGTSPRA